MYKRQGLDGPTRSICATRDHLSEGGVRRLQKSSPELPIPSIRCKRPIFGIRRVTRNLQPSRMCEQGRSPAWRNPSATAHCSNRSRLAVGEVRLALPNFYNVTVRIANVAASLAVLVLSLIHIFSWTPNPASEFSVDKTYRSRGLCSRIKSALQFIES